MSIDTSALTIDANVTLNLHSSIDTSTFTGVIVAPSLAYAGARAFNDVAADHAAYTPDNPSTVKADVEDLEFILVRQTNGVMRAFAVEHLVNLVISTLTQTNVVLYDLAEAQLTQLRMFLTALGVNYTIATE